MSRIDLTDYERGWIEGVALYAVWQSGTRYVGSTGRTFGDAVYDFLVDRGFDPDAAREVARVS